MAVGIGIIGRDVTATVGGSALGGVITKGVTLNNEKLDTTDDASSGWSEALAEAGLKSAEYSISGTLKNLELMATWSGTSQIMEIILTYPDGSTLTFDGFLDSFSPTGESNGLLTYDASFSSSGAVVFVAGV